MLTYSICSTKRVHGQLQDYCYILAMNPGLSFYETHKHINVYNKTVHQKSISVATLGRGPFLLTYLSILKIKGTL